MQTSEKAGALALNAIFGFEPKIAKAIIDSLGSAVRVFNLNDNELTDLFGPCSKYKPRIRQETLRQAEKELERLELSGLQFVCILDDEYPKALLECEDPPVGLYVRSDTPAAELFRKEPRISVVGTRDISLYGSEWCRRIVGAMARTTTAPVIVSGLAIGVDITAHEAALECGLPTIAVLPTGIDDVYPRRHVQAAGRIAATPGCALVTDYPPGIAPQAVNFIRRNRIIAGLSQATVLVESKIKGGGTLTARLAAGYGRDVYALPGRIEDVRSAGCNLLIQEKIAEPIASLPSFIESLGLGRWNRRREKNLNEELLSFYSRSRCADQIHSLCAVAEIVRTHRGISCEEIARGLGLSYSDVIILAEMLESDGFITIDLMQRCAIATKIV